VIPHAPHYLPAVKKNKKTTETFNIGLIGVLCYKKVSLGISSLVYLPVWENTGLSISSSEVPISLRRIFSSFLLPVGAPVERVKRYAKGLVLKDEKPENIVEEMISLWKTLGESELPVEKRRLLFVGEEISFASSYRAAHITRSSTS